MEFSKDSSISIFSSESCCELTFEKFSRSGANRMCVCELNSARNMIHIKIQLALQGGEDPKDALSLQVGHFPQKSPIISVSFAKIDLQFKALYGPSLPCSS